MGSSVVESKSQLEGIGGSDDNLTPLQKHVAFFDQNHDGVVYPWETYKGFRAVGCGIPLSIAGGLFVNAKLSGKTRPGKKWPNLLFPVYINNIQLAMHGSDSGVYDAEGRFVPSKFEEMFRKHAHTNSNGLTKDEVKELRRANRDPKDYSGWFTSFTEWTLLYTLAKDKNGLLHKDTLKSFFDGSLLYELAEKKKASSGKKKGDE